MLKLFKFLKPYWWQVLLLIMFTGGEVFATLQLPALMADIINKGIVIGDTDYIWKTGLIMVGIATASAGCALASSYFSARVGANFSRDIRAAMYNKVINLIRTATGKLIQLIDKEGIEITEYIVPNDVTTIGESAFIGCSDLTSLRVEPGNIRFDSRDNCNAIIITESNSLLYGSKNTIIPDGITSIGSYAFGGISGLTSITYRIIILSS